VMSLARLPQMPRSGAVVPEVIGDQVLPS